MTRQVSIELSSEPSSQDAHPESPPDNSPSNKNSPSQMLKPPSRATSDSPEHRGSISSPFHGTDVFSPQQLDVTANPLQRTQLPAPQHTDRQHSSLQQSPFVSTDSSFSMPKQNQQISPPPKLPPIEVSMYGRGTNALDAEGGAPAGVSPSSTMRDLEAACGPLSAASGSLDAMNIPPTQESGILPWCWTQIKLKRHHYCECQLFVLILPLLHMLHFTLLHTVLLSQRNDQHVSEVVN